MAVPNFTFYGTSSNPISETSSGATTPSPLTTGSSSSTASIVAPYPVGPLGSSSATPNILTSSLGTTMFGPLPSLFGPSIPFGSNTTMAFPSSPLVRSPATGLFGSSSSSATQPSGGTSLTLSLSAPVVTRASTTPSLSATLPSFGNVPLGSYLNYMSSKKDVLIKEIFERHGDITKSSRVKSEEAKSAFLLLVVEVVERLRSYNKPDIVDSYELELIQRWIDDVGSVGFDIGWLEQKVTRLKYHVKLKKMKKISEEVSGVKKALLEMENQEVILMKQVDGLRSELVEMGEEDICSTTFW